MDKLITALAPVFAAGMGIQQLGEILSPVIDRINADYKKVVIGLISLSLSLAIAFNADLRILETLNLEGARGDQLNFLDELITGFIISGGTEGINSILKFLKYKKEEVKNEAATKSPANAEAARAANVPVPTEAALAEINKK